MSESTAARIRLDKWLWAARLFKTRGLATEVIGKGQVRVNGAAAKPAREVHLGDLIDLVHGQLPMQIVVKGLSDRRGPAAEAQTLYEQTPQSIAARQALVEQRRAGVEPAHTLEQGRPTKRDRRKLADWNRWSATDEGL